MSETKKITKEQLDSLVNAQRELNTVLGNIGVLESQKHGLLHQLADINKSLEELKSKLENQYGAININLEDGSYTDIEKESSKMDVV